MARKFYYDTGEEKVGPVSGEDLLRLRASGDISDETWVRRSDSATWRPLHSVNLNEEEEKLRNPGLFKILKQSGMLVPFIFIATALGLIVLSLFGFWPILLLGLLIWLFKKQ